MSSMSDQMIEHGQEKFDNALARYLGITRDELEELNYELDDETSNDDMHIGYILEFGDDAPQEILDKVKLKHPSTPIYIGLHDIDTESDGHEFTNKDNGDGSEQGFLNFPTDFAKQTIQANKENEERKNKGV